MGGSTKKDKQVKRWEEPWDWTCTWVLPGFTKCFEFWVEGRTAGAVLSVHYMCIGLWALKCAFLMQS